MFIPFIFTSYKHSFAATAVSFIGSMLAVCGIPIVIEAFQSHQSVAEALGACAFMVVLGLLLRRWAERIARKKLEKLTRRALSR